MILVTVGSTYFDALIREVDVLVSEGFLAEDVVCQIGSGNYTPTSCEYVRHIDNFDDYLDSCSFVITHGGMTVLEAMWKKKLMVAVANTGIPGNHQAAFLEKLSKISGLIWTDDPKNLRRLVPLAKDRGITFSEPHIAEYIRSFVSNLN